MATFLTRRTNATPYGHDSNINSLHASGWATGLIAGSGLPFEFGGEHDGALAQYGPSVVGRLNFDRGRVDPFLSIQASLGVDVYKARGSTPVSRPMGTTSTTGSM